MDWIYNNNSIFFLRDPVKFSNFIHTQNHRPATHATYSDESTAFWDYFGQDPESTHQMLYLFGDSGRPKTRRHMQGYSGHIFKFVAIHG